MKIETFEKAKSLVKRIESIALISIGTSHDKDPKPDDPKKTDFTVILSDKDADDLTKHIEKWIKLRKSSLQKEFDNLK